MSGGPALRGSDALGQWKYVPVRRTGICIEESLYRGMQWMVFEPNDEPLWEEAHYYAIVIKEQGFRRLKANRGRLRNMERPTGMPASYPAGRVLTSFSGA